MNELIMKVDDFQSKNSVTLQGYFNCGKLSLDLVSKKLCAHCKRERKNNYSCCGSYNSNIVNLEIKANIEHNCDLKTDMHRLLFQESFSDFHFIVDKEKIPVSKCILAARSPVFERMFYSDFKEKTQNQQIIKAPFLKPAFKELIRYIYTDEVSDLSKYVFDLLYASDYYQILSLKTVCEDEMRKTLCADNAYKIFQSAHRFQCDSGLKTAAFVIIKNIFQKMNLTVPDEFVNNPTKVAKLFEKKESLEKELVIAVPNTKK
ncbi:speckle-type POZ protein B-like [Chironomus tepperi]|uniref:speckle-type POZ protein B-like n=1 Tax=Chironomus tepperi TaxID=113505 RepID=UPI00391EF60B